MTSEAMVERDGQTALPEDGSLILTGARRLIDAVRDAARTNDLTLERLALVAGKGDAPAISRLLDLKDPHLAWRVLAALIALDVPRVFLGKANGMVDCDCVPRIRLTDAEFRRRVEAHAKRSKTAAAALEEALGEDG